MSICSLVFRSSFLVSLFQEYVHSWAVLAVSFDHVDKVSDRDQIVGVRSSLALRFTVRPLARFHVDKSFAHLFHAHDR